MRTKLLSKLMLLLTMMFVGVGSAVGDTTTTYTFNSKSWGDANNTWQSDMAGYQYQSSNSGYVQVTAAYSGAGATSNQEFSNITSITVNASTTAKGVGNITIKVGSGEEQTICSLSKAPTWTDYTLNFDTPVSGKIKFVVNCSTNSMYLSSIKVTTTGGSDPQPITTVATPTFSPAAGTVNANTQVTISSQTAGATIYYTTDGSDPSTSNTRTQGTTLTITQTTTVKAIAVKSGMNNSEVATAVYTVAAITDGVFDFAAGNNYGSGYEPGNVKVQEGTWTAGNVTMAAAGRNCWYTNGSFRLYKANGNDAAGSITFAVPVGKIITKIEFEGSNLQISPSTGSLGSGTWTGAASTVTFSAADATNTVIIDKITVTYGEGTAVESVVTPTFSPVAGTVVAGTQVTISTQTAGATIYYTTDGSDPTTSNTRIQGTTLTINATTTVKAYAVKSGLTDSGVVTAVYTVRAIEDGKFDFESRLFDYGSGVEPSNDGNTYITEEKTWTAGNVTLVTAGKYRWWSTDGTLRFYDNSPTSTMTISVPAGYAITQIAITGGQQWSSADELYSSSNGKWIGRAQSVILSQATSSRVDVKTVTVTYEESNIPATPTFSVASGEYEVAQSIAISCETTGASIYYTLDGTEPTAQSTPYTQAITISQIGTTTIKAIAIKNGESSGVAVATYTILDPNRPGSESNPYTVAQAIAAIDANTGLTGVYVTGIVSKIVTAYNSQYGNISYNISVDGSENSDQLEAFRGKGFDGENFTSEDDIQVGDQVVIYGNLTKYGSTYELAADNYLVSQVKKTAAPSISGPATFVTEATVTITASEGATIYYTLDGSDPTTNANRLLYTEPFTIEATTTVKAVAVANNMYSAVVSQTFTQIEVTNGIFELVYDDSSLKAGDQILIAYVEDGTAKAMSATQANNNRPAVDVTLIDEITLTPGDDAQVITLEEDEDASAFLFNVGNGYLYAANSGSNWLRTETTPDADGNANATIAIEDGKATILFQGTNTRNLVRYNPNNGSPIFSCYEQKESPTGKAPMIFRKVVDELPGDVNHDDEVNYEDVEVLVSLILYEDTDDACDVNKDGQVSLADVTALVNILRQLNQ